MQEPTDPRYEPKYLTTSQMLATYNISKRTLCYWVKEKRIKRVNAANGRGNESIFEVNAFDLRLEKPQVKED